MALGSLGTPTNSTSTAVAASPRFLAAAIAIRILLVLGVLAVPAAGDLCSTALAAASVALILATHALR